MPWKVRFANLAFYLLPFSLCITLVAAAPPAQLESPDEFVRRANEAFRADDKDTADELYAAAEERTRDPGLVAFNRAAILFERGEFREAEKHYDRVLDDAACPADRAAKAWYNRGTCLLNRGGSMSVFRSAIACFEHTLDSAAADEPLKADARHNLQLAKLRWVEEAKKEKEKKNDPPSPNNETPQEENPRKQEPEMQPGGADANQANEKNGGSKLGPQAMQKKENAVPTSADQNTAANNPNLQPLIDNQQVQQLSPDEARAILKETSKRRKRELHSLLESLSGPPRADVRDW